MPLPFLLHAAAAAATGEYLISGKALALGLTVALWLLVVEAARRLGSPWPLTLALAGVVLASGSGFLAGTTIRGDLLPVVLQLSALAVAARFPTASGAVLAGLLCTLALLAKITAGWAAVALLLHWLIHDRRAAACFVVTGLVSLAAGLALLHVVSNGRMLDNFTTLSAAGLDGARAVARGPFRLVLFMGKGGSATHCLFPLALFGCWLAWRERRWTPIHTSLVVCLAALTVVYADLGAVSNHLLDLVVLSALVVGGAWPQGEAEAARALRPVLGLAVGWCLATCWAYGMADELRVAAARLAGNGDARFPAKPLAGLVNDDEPVLTDDPWVAVARPTTGRPRRLLAGPDGTGRPRGGRRSGAAYLRPRVRQGDPQQPAGREPGELDAVYLGRPVIDAIRRNYTLATRAEGYLVYLPNAEQ